MRCTPLPFVLAASLLLPLPASGENDPAGTTKALQRAVAAWQATDLDAGAFRAYALWQTCARTPQWRAAATGDHVADQSELEQVWREDRATARDLADARASYQALVDEASGALD